MSNLQISFHLVGLTLKKSSIRIVTVAKKIYSYRDA